EINFRPDPSVYDGQFTNNGWLQELPKQLTKLVWDNAALMSPATAEKLGVENDELVDLQYLGRKVSAPVWIQAGHAADCITVHLGYGRSHAGRVGGNIGFNPSSIRNSNTPCSGSGLTVTKTGLRYRLCITQDHQTMEGRHILLSGSFEEYEKEPKMFKEIE